jgi:threonine-phosphate decarboxylase
MKEQGIFIEHGGNIYRLAEELRLPENKIIDFSASINPLGVPKRVRMALQRELKSLHNYPDPETKELRRSLSQYHDIDPETILCSNGSTELIYLIPRALKPKKVLIPSPTFLEYERAVFRAQDQAHRIQIKELMLKKEGQFEIKPDEFINAMHGCDMAFLCNPNNPTGNLLRKEAVLKIAEAAKGLRCLLIVDEAFIDFQPEESVIRDVQDNPYLIVLRSMTKFYALSGLRIGYGVLPVNLINRIKEFKEPWTVNSLAQKAAIMAIEDRVYVVETLRLIKKEKGFLENSFKKKGIKFFPSTANFYLLKINNRIDLKLRERGILVRNCSNFKGLDDSYIRIAVKTGKENRLLINALAEYIRR